MSAVHGNASLRAIAAADKPVGDTRVYASDLAQANAEADAIVSRNLDAEE